MPIHRPKIVITTIPFASIAPEPLAILQSTGAEVVINSLGRRLQPAEVAQVIGDADVVVAGTELIGADVMERCSNLKAICRVGIGLDGIDLIEARRRGIAVCYTPDAPSPAVAELVMGLMLDLLRDIAGTDRKMRKGIWDRYAGRRLSDCCVGIIGVGRIGGRVVRHLAGAFPGIRILAHDIVPPPGLDDLVEWTDLESLLRRSDLISLHVPLTPDTRNLLNAARIEIMKREAMLINTARGGIVNEYALLAALDDGRLAGAAMDVFEVEPYTGPLCNCPKVLLTAHLGSMTRDCRAQMEIEASQEAARFLNGEPFVNPVPDNEYVDRGSLATQA